MTSQESQRNARQRQHWAENREACLIRSRANYAKHAVKRREESAIRKVNNREYYALAEWFRKKGIPISQIDRSDLKALIEMKRAVKEAKRQTINHQ